MIIESIDNFRVQEGSLLTSGSPPDHLTEQPDIPCNGCRILTCKSIHGPPAQNCSLEGCYCCADLASINDEISNAYQRLLDLVQKREQIIEKPHNNPSTERVPAEILSSIFHFVKDTYNDDSGRPMFSQPHRSPPLLVGAVCNKWREVSLQTPYLWTDIIVDLMKPADAALNMVNEWARRAGALPLNLTIFLDSDDSDYVQKEAGVLIKSLRSLAFRWNNLSLQTPWAVYQDLLTELEETPNINSFYTQMADDWRHERAAIKLRDPLRPKYFYAEGTYAITGVEIPFEWDNLVYLKIYNVRGGVLLHIIRRAQNLEHCDATYLGQESEAYPIPATQITNRSLIHLRILARHGNIIESLTLPSLQHLEYLTSRNSQFHSLVRFIERSSPLLHTFILHCEIQQGAPNLPFEKLFGITDLSLIFNADDEPDDAIEEFVGTLTSLSTRPILPYLNKLAFDLPSMSSYSWSLLGSLTSKDTLRQEGIMSADSNVAFIRPLSKVGVFIGDDFQDPMSKDTFLHLLAARKSGVDLDLKLRCGLDFFNKMAELYHVRL